jgi:hypothetical protein
MAQEGLNDVKLLRITQIYDDFHESEFRENIYGKKVFFTMDKNIPKLF